MPRMEISTTRQPILSIASEPQVQKTPSHSTSLTAMRLDAIVAIIHHRTVCHTNEFLEELDINNWQLHNLRSAYFEEKGIRVVNTGRSSARHNKRYTRSDVFYPSLLHGNYYFEEPFNESVALYFAKFIKIPVESHNARAVTKFFVDFGFTIAEARVIVAQKYGFSKDSLARFSRRERYAHDLQSVKHR